MNGAKQKLPAKTKLNWRLWVFLLRNSIAELWINSTIKNELLKDMEFHSVKDLAAALDRAIDFYNNERPHASLGMMTPVAAAGFEGRFKRFWHSYREEAIDMASTENRGLTPTG